MADRKNNKKKAKNKSKTKSLKPNTESSVRLDLDGWDVSKI